MKRLSSGGFTLIELVLAMSIFIAVLVISTAGFIGINQTYGKGLLRKQLSEATQRTVENITKTMREYDALDVVAGNDKALCNSTTCYVWGYGDSGSGLARTKSNKPSELDDKYELVDGRFKVEFIEVAPVGLKGDLYNIRGLIRTKDDDAFSELTNPDTDKIKCKGTTETNASRGCALERFSIIVNVKAGSI